MTVTIPRRGAWAAPFHSIDNVTGGWVAWQAAPSSAVAWGTANRAIYVPIRVPTACVVRELGYASNTTATGNIDIGLYDSAGTRLVSTGSTAKTSTAVMAALDVTDTTIGPGLYYIGLNNTTTTDTFTAFTDTAPLSAARGYLTEALGSVTLPATATFDVDDTLATLPVVSALLVTEVS